MSSDLDLKKTPENRELLSAMRAEMRGLRTRRYFSHTLAGILWLDDAKGLSKADDYVWVDQIFGEQLMYESSNVLSDQLYDLFEEGTVHGIQQAMDDFYRMAVDPFVIRFGRTATDPGVPSSIRGRNVRVAIMPRIKLLSPAGGTITAITKRADGSYVDDIQPLVRDLPAPPRIICNRTSL